MRVIGHVIYSSLLLLYISLLSTLISSSSSSLPFSDNNDYHQDYFGEDDKRIIDIVDILENYFKNLTEAHQPKENWTLYKLMLYTQLEPDIGIKYKIYFSSKHIKENIIKIHYGVVFCTKSDSNCTVIEYEELQGTKMKINNRKYGLINSIMNQSLTKYSQKLLFLTQIFSYEKIINNHSLYLVSAILKDLPLLSFVVFEDEDNKLSLCGVMLD